MFKLVSNILYYDINFNLSKGIDENKKTIDI